MIKECKCVGLSYCKSIKKNKVFSKLYIDVSNCFDDSNMLGNIVETAFIFSEVDRSIIGQSVTCSVDRFGRIQDIEF